MLPFGPTINVFLGYDWERKKNKQPTAITVVICDSLYIKKVQADEVVCKYVINAEKRTL